MSRTFSMSAVGFVLLLLPAQLLAGGPARLCLPIDGVTAESAAACAQLMTDGLGDKLFPREPLREVVLEQHENQWYALVYLAWDADVKLSDVEAALSGSRFSVPRDRLRFFGPVRLEVDVRADAHEALMKDLAALKHVEIEESNQKDDSLLVTMILPENGRRDIFRLLSASADESKVSTPPITVEALPSYAALRDLTTEHDAALNDVHWSGEWGCRMLGSLAVPDQDEKLGKVAAAR